MGFAKYCEDNIRLTEERRYYRDHEAELGGNRISRSENTKNYKISINNIGPIVDNSCSYQNSTQPGFTLRNKSMCMKKKVSAKSLICKDCGREFVFPIQEQKYFDKNKWAPPVRCKECRKIKTVIQVMRGWN